MEQSAEIIGTADILKIVIPIILTLIGAMVSTVLWVFHREQRTKETQETATKQYWQTVNNNLERMISGLDERLTLHGKDAEQETLRLHGRVNSLERELHEFKVLVAGEYLKRELWGENHNNLERKIENLRTDISKELKSLTEQLIKWGKPQ